MSLASHNGLKTTLMSIDNKTLKFFNKLTSYQQTNFIYNYIKKTVFYATNGKNN